MWGGDGGWTKKFCCDMAPKVFFGGVLCCCCCCCWFSCLLVCFLFCLGGGVEFRPIIIDKNQGVNRESWVLNHPKNIKELHWISPLFEITTLGGNFLCIWKVFITRTGYLKSKAFSPCNAWQVIERGEDIEYVSQELDKLCRGLKI